MPDGLELPLSKTSNWFGSAHGGDELSGFRALKKNIIMLLRCQALILLDFVSNTINRELVDVLPFSMSEGVKEVGVLCSGCCAFMLSFCFEIVCSLRACHSREA